jgi:SAM-dependent methyltransferase
MNDTLQLKNYYERYWDAGSSVYSGTLQGYANNFRRWMQAELKDLSPQDGILEVGCGDASFTQHLARHSARVTALDISASQVERNARQFPRINFLQHDVANPLPFADSSFSAVWCSEVLEHLFDPGFALEEMHRVLVPGGRLLVTVPYHGLFKDVLIALFKWDEHFDPSNPHIRFFNRQTLEELTRTAGFKKIQMRTCGMNRPLRDLFVPTNILMRATKAAGAV